VQLWSFVRTPHSAIPSPHMRLPDGSGASGTAEYAVVPPVDYEVSVSLAKESRLEICSSCKTPEIVAIKAPTVHYTLLYIYGKYHICIRICIHTLGIPAYTVVILYTVFVYGWYTVFIKYTSGPALRVLSPPPLYSRLTSTASISIRLFSSVLGLPAQVSSSAPTPGPSAASSSSAGGTRAAAADDAETRWRHCTTQTCSPPACTVGDGR
jgi:hypothetical protein